MYRYLLIGMALLLMAAAPSEAQRRGGSRVGMSSIAPAPEIFVFGGWMAPGGVDAYLGRDYGRLDVTSGPIFGGSIAVPARPGTSLELTYMYNAAGYIFEPRVPPGPDEPKVDLDVHYMQIGAQQYLPNGNIHPYGSFTVGAAVFGSQWELAFTGGIGVKNYINEKIALRVDARLVLPVFWGGFGISCGTGGCGSGFGGTVGMWQGAFTGGLVYRLGQ